MRVVIAKELHQQPDQQAADGADQDGKQARIHTQRLCGLFPNQARALMDEGHKSKGNQGADQAQQDDERHEFDVGCRFGLWVNHPHSLLDLLKLAIRMCTLIRSTHSGNTSGAQ